MLTLVAGAQVMLNESHSPTTAMEEASIVSGIAISDSVKKKLGIDIFDATRRN